MRAGVGCPFASSTRTRTRPVGVRLVRALMGTARHEESGPPPIGAVYNTIGPDRLDTNANRLPAGLGVGEYSSRASAVSTVGLPPLAGITATSFEPNSSDTYRNAWLSGVHTGFILYSVSS